MDPSSSSGGPRPGRGHRRRARRGGRDRLQLLRRSLAPWPRRCEPSPPPPGVRPRGRAGGAHRHRPGRRPAAAAAADDDRHARCPRRWAPGAVGAAGRSRGPAPCSAAPSSPWFSPSRPHPVPDGLARRAEPRLGFHVDLPTLLLGRAAAALLVALLVGALATWRVRRSTDGPRSRRRDRSAPPPTCGLPAPAVTGLSLASGTPGRPGRIAVGGTLLSVLGVLAALVFSASVDRLRDDPDLYGWGWDAAIEGADLTDLAGASDLGCTDRTRTTPWSPPGPSTPRSRSPSTARPASPPPWWPPRATSSLSWCRGGAGPPRRAGGRRGHPRGDRRGGRRQGGRLERWPRTGHAHHRGRRAPRPRGRRLQRQRRLPEPGQHRAARCPGRVRGERLVHQDRRGRSPAGADAALVAQRYEDPEAGTSVALPSPPGEVDRLTAVEDLPRYMAIFLAAAGGGRHQLRHRHHRPAAPPRPGRAPRARA